MVSIMIHTHNPRPDAFARTLAGLRAQTTPPNRWELVIIDNCSEPPVAELADLSWHPTARVIREDQRGAYHARLRGLRESRGELIICVDDDNVLDPDYIEQALDISRRWPMLGAWGGQLVGVYEEEAPDWAMAYSHHLAVLEFSQSRWASFIDDRSVPYGAGMCLRREVAQAYAQRTETDPLCSRFGRSGKSTVSGDDHLICYTGRQLGYGTGKFTQLRLKHLISKSRLQPAYFLKTARGNAQAAMLLRTLNPENGKPGFKSHLLWPLLKLSISWIIYRGMRRRIFCAQALGEMDALLKLRRPEWKTPPAEDVPSWATPAGQGAPMA